MKKTPSKSTKSVAVRAVPVPKSVQNTVWDVVVIGGGPSGMMAAGRAAESYKDGAHAKVLLVEKNSTLGKKLLLTGGGRCNVTNATFDTRKLLEKFRNNGKFLFSAFSQHAVQDSLDFFNSRKMQTKVEAENRVFPITDKSSSVLNVLLDYIKKGGVTVLSDAPVAKLNTESDTASQTASKNDKKKMKSLTLNDGTEIFAKSFILATGGQAYPETGSTGDGFVWLKKLGHTVHKADSALVPIIIKDAWIKNVQGITLPDVKISLIQDGKKLETKKGKILFTHFGVSGPTVLNMSKQVSEMLVGSSGYSNVVLGLDIFPKDDYSSLNKKLQDLFTLQSNKKFKNSMPELMPTALVSVIAELAGIDAEKFSHSVTREERVTLMKLLKEIPLHVGGLLSPEHAIVASGGVDLKEVDFKTMQSRIVSNLYMTGDILNIDRPSGGYSLQLCWTTGFVAGTHCLENVAEEK